MLKSAMVVAACLSFAGPALAAGAYDGTYVGDYTSDLPMCGSGPIKMVVTDGAATLGVKKPIPGKVDDQGAVTLSGIIDPANAWMADITGTIKDGVFTGKGTMHGTKKSCSVSYTLTRKPAG